MTRYEIRHRAGAIPADAPQPAADGLATPLATGEAWSCYHGTEGARSHLPIDDLKRAIASGTGTLWVDIDNRKPEEVALLTDLFGFHPLAIEDSLNPDSRVKIEEYNGYLILVVRTVDFIHETEDPYDIDTVNLTCFLGKNYLVTVHGADSNPVQATVALLERKPELAAAGPARLMHAVVDEAVNAYFPILDQLDLFMDSLEERVFAQFDQGALREIFSVKRLVLSLRRHLAPQRDVFGILTNRPSTLLSLDTQIYFRDIHDHVLRINDALETYRELLSNTLDSYLTQVSNRLGTVTKALSAVATVSIPFVVVSGMWGMNFDKIPLAHSAYGFWTMLAVQLGLGFLLLAVLRWRKLL
ncbi:MAG TPA: magnesium transporter CorA family protein [Gemmatimonadaceae bacterium]|nr:magnesium transporter CorA family protein [Gemmatimonadaceae bacterium]